MNQRILKNKSKLQRLKKQIADATEQKKLDEFQKELQMIETEIYAIEDFTLKSAYLKKLENIKTTDEIFRLYKEIQALKKDTAKRNEELNEKENSIKKRDDVRDEVLQTLDDLDEVKRKFQKRMQEMFQTRDVIRKKVETEIKVQETVEIVQKRKSILLDSLCFIYLMKLDMDPLIKIPLSLVVVDTILDKLYEKDEEIIRYEYSYEDISKTIDAAMDSIEDIEKEMKSSLEEVEYFTKQFEKDFSEFRHLKEFDDILGMFQTIEKELQKELGMAQEMEKELDKSLNINKEKVLKVDSYN